MGKNATFRFLTKLPENETLILGSLIISKVTEKQRHIEKIIILDLTTFKLIGFPL